MAIRIKYNLYALKVHSKQSSFKVFVVTPCSHCLAKIAFIPENICDDMHCDGWIKFMWSLTVTSTISHYLAGKCKISSVVNLAVFPRNWTCFFVELRVFLKACGLLVFGLVVNEICLLFGLVFCRFLFCGLLFFKFYGTFALSIYC